MTRKCKVCSSIYRDEIDSYLAKNTYTFNDIAKMFQDKGFIISASTIRRHATLHTNYEFKTNEIKTIEISDMSNNDGFDMSIDFESYLAQFSISESDFKVESIDDFFKVSKNFYAMNTALLMKLYAVVNLQVDLNIKGIGNFPIDKVKCLNLLMTLNNNLHTQVQNYDITKCERGNTAYLLKGLCENVELWIKRNDMEGLQDLLEAIREHSTNIIEENNIMYDDYIKGLYQTSKSEKAIKESVEFFKKSKEDLEKL